MRKFIDFTAEQQEYIKIEARAQERSRAEIIKDIESDEAVVVAWAAKTYDRLIVDLIALHDQTTDEHARRYDAGVEHDAQQLHDMGRADPERQAASIIDYTGLAKDDDRHAYDTMAALDALYQSKDDPNNPAPDSLSPFVELVMADHLTQPPHAANHPTERLLHVIRAEAASAAEIAFDLAPTAARRRVAADTGFGETAIRTSITAVWKQLNEIDEALADRLPSNPHTASD